MKKNKGDEPIGVLMHIYMEMSQGNSLCSYLYLFSSTKSENRREDQVLQEWRRLGGLILVGGGEEVGKGCRRINTVQKMFTHVCTCYLLKLF
jgi:hypothetical protein